MTSEHQIVQRLVYGEAPPQLQPRPASVSLRPDGTAAFDPGTQLIYAPLRTVKRGRAAAALRSWPAGMAPERVLEADGAWVLTPRCACSSLEAMAMERNCAYVNALGRAELLAAELAAVKAPAPLGNGVRIYAAYLATVEADGLERAAASLEGRPLRALHFGADWWLTMDRLDTGFLRTHAATRALGWNAPLDSYLRIAHDLALGYVPEGY